MGTDSDKMYHFCRLKLDIIDEVYRMGKGFSERIGRIDAYVHFVYRHRINIIRKTDGGKYLY